MRTATTSYQISAQTATGCAACDIADKPGAALGSEEERRHCGGVSDPVSCDGQHIISDERANRDQLRAG
jgi:hypothetical protein